MNSILDLVRRQAQRGPLAVAFEAPGRPALRYEGLLAAVEHGARSLANVGVGAGDPVALVLPDGPELATAFLAAASRGVAAPLNPALAPRELQQHLELLRPRCVVLPAGRSQAAARAAAEALGLCVIEVAWDASAAAGQMTWSGGTAPESPGRARDLAILLATSGTTARPKLVGLSHANLLASAGQVSRALELTPEDSALCMVPLFHGSGLFNVLLPSLAAGARVVLAPAFLAPRFFEWVESHRPTWYQGAPAMHQAILRRARSHQRAIETAPLRFVRSSSAPLPPTVLVALEEALRAPAIEGYGMTEANQIACNPLPPRARKAGTVGLPSGTEVAVLGPDGANLPAGSSGEVVLRGPNVMAGYVDDAEANAAAFVDGWFRSGDVGYLDDEGYLSLTGRLKELINRGGEKIAPREVDEALLEHPAVAEAVCFAMPHASLGEDVAAAVRLSPGMRVTEQELREHVAARLAPFKVPARLAFVDAIPRGPTGKPQRIGTWQRLGLEAAPQAPARARRVEPPVGESEALIASIWAEVLGLPEVGRNELFLDLGGDSVLAARIALRLSAALGIEVPLVALFGTPTVAAMATLAEGRLRAPAARGPLARGAASAPCSAGQRQLWLFEQLTADVSPYVHTEALRVSGPLRLASLRAALEALSTRHEVLRTTCEPGPTGPVQRIGAPRAFDVRTADASAAPEPARDAAIFIEGVARERFDLAVDFPLRAALVKLGDDDHVLAVITHHVALDAWSMRTLLSELAALYQAAEEGQPHALPPLPIQYADFAAWHADWVEEEVLPRQLAYWTQALGGAVDDIELPSDRPRPAVQSHRGGSVSRVLAEPLVAELQRFSRAAGVSLFTTLLTGFAALLHRLSGAESIRIGAPVAGRPVAEAEPLIGLFVNLLVLRSDASADPRFREAVERTRAMLLGALANQDVPFHRLVEALQPARRLSHNPVFQVAFNWREYDALRFEPRGLRSQPWPAPAYASRFDLTLYGQLEEGRVAFSAEYSSDLFEATTVAGWLEQLEALLGAAIATPDARLSELPLFSQAERARLLSLGHAPRSAFRSEATLWSLFEETARRDPSAVALVSDGRPVSYAELEARARHLERALRAAGARPGAVVGVALERSPASVGATLAVLAAGATVLPLDPDYPDARLRFLVEDARARIVVAGARPEWLVDAGVAVVDPAATGPTLETPRPDPGTAAYLIYTSGSSGAPKGVAGSHGASVNRLEWMAEAYPWAPDDVACLKTSVGFVDAVAELWGPLLAGVRTVVLTQDEARDPRLLADAIATHRVTRLVAVPSLLEALLEVKDVEQRLASLRLCVSSGEPLGVDLARRWRAALPRTRLLNLYGSTEVAADATAFEVTTLAPEATRVPVGFPIANLRAHVLDAHMEPVAAGVTGELWIGGAGLALGYHGRPELTAQRFVADPFADGERLFRTGDLARRLPDGGLDLLGRADDQLKVRGVRVEPNEVEAVLREHPAVLEAAVARRGDGAAALLAGWVVAREGMAVDVADVLEHARRSLPGHSVPNRLQVTARLPRTTSGKLDRRALSLETVVPGAPLERTPPVTPTEQILAVVWSQLLNLDAPWREADFFAVGGHSLTAVRMVAAINRLVPHGIELRDVFAHPRLAELARVVDEPRGSEAPREPAVRPVDAATPVPLSFGQERLWFLHHLHPGTAAFNLGIVGEVQGRIDAALWRRAVPTLVERHAALRTVFQNTPEGAVQVLADAAGVEVVIEDGTGPAAAQLFAERLTRAPFDLGAPLFRAGLLRLDGGAQHIVLVLHHAIADGWSLGLLARDLGLAYRAAAAGTPPPPPTRVDGRALGAWQRHALGNESAWWRDQLAGPETPLDLPADRPRPRHRALAGARVSADWSRALAERVRGLAASEGVTPFVVLLTAFKRLLQRETGVDDVRVATFVAGRERREFEDVIGFFVNTLVLRTRLDATAPFLDDLGRVAETVKRALQHARAPFEQVVAELSPRRDPSRPTLAQVAFVLQSMPWPPAAFGTGTAEFSSVDNGASGFDLTLYLRDTPTGLRGVLEYDSALFDAPRMERLLAGFGTLLENALAAPGDRAEPAARHAATAVSARAALVSPARGRPPADELERSLLAVWSEVLGRRELSADDNFFDVGGHSLLAVTLFERIETRLGRRLPIATLFDAPSVAELARALRAPASTPSETGLYAVQPHGRRRPFFYVPSRFFMQRDAVNVVGLSGLARRLGDEQPLYSFCVERAEQATSARAEELAEAFVADLRAVQPRGPYAIGGTSSGGLVAFDMAARLRAQGEVVAILVLFDTYAPGYPRRTHWREAGYWTARARRGLRYADKLLRLGPRAGLRELLTRTTHGPAPLPLTLRRPSHAGWRPQPFPGRVVLFRSSVQERFDLWGHCYDDARNGWGRFTPQVETRAIPGRHDAMLEGEALDVLARELRACLAEGLSADAARGPAS